MTFTVCMAPADLTSKKVPNPALNATAPPPPTASVAPLTADTHAVAGGVPGLDSDGQTASASATKTARLRLQPTTSLRLAFVRQVIMDEPFKAVHGRTEEAWDRCAETLKTLDGADGQECRRVQLDGDKLKRFVSAMVEKAKKEELDSLRASGVDELFDDFKSEMTSLVALLDDHEMERMVAKRSEAAKKALMRDAVAAMQRLGSKSPAMARRTRALSPACASGMHMLKLRARAPGAGDDDGSVASGVDDDEMTSVASAGSRSGCKRKRTPDVISDIAAALNQPLPPLEDREVTLRRLDIERERISLEREQLRAQREMMQELRDSHRETMREVRESGLEQTKLMLGAMRSFMNEAFDRLSKDK